MKDYVEKTLAAYGRIDAFFNNAGIEGKVVPIQDYDEAVFDQVIAVNLKGVFLGMRHVLPVMLKQGSGTIVNTASVAGLFGAPGMAAYVASKHGVLGLTKVAASRCRRVWRAGERGVSRTGGDADDALAGGATEPKRSGWRACRLCRRNPDRALRAAGGNRWRGAVSYPPICRAT